MGNYYCKKCNISQKYYNNDNTNNKQFSSCRIHSINQNYECIYDTCRDNNCRDNCRHEWVWKIL